MNQFFLLTGDQRKQYEFMIPQWLLDIETDLADVDFWGMKSYDSPSGVAVLIREDKEMILKYLYVAEEYRYAGRGREFFWELINSAYKKGCKSFVISYMPGQFPDFEKLLWPYPFRSEEEEVGSFSVSIKELTEIPQLQGSYRSVKPLSECSEQSLQPLYRMMMEEGEDYVALPLKKSEYLADCCAVAFEKDQPSGILLVKQVSDQEVTLPLIINFSHNALSTMEMMRFAVSQGSRVLSPETRCSFDVVNGALLQLMEKMGIRAECRRQRSILDLSFVEEIEREAEKTIFEKLIDTDYVFEGLEKL